ncbi:MAG: hypothetical protein L0338_01965 [Acidobacteria bacterium]|nr:hypothetical protein [Acidobacteriota bacterium]
MEHRDVAAQVRNGVRLAGLGLFSLLVAGIFTVGILYTFFPVGRSRALGGAFLAVSIPIMVMSMERWIRPFSGVLILAVLNGLIMLSTGKLLHDSGVSVPRLNMVVLILFSVCSVVLLQTFWDRKLAVIDRIVVMAYIIDLALLLGYSSTRIMPSGTVGRLRLLEFIGMALGLGCLLAGWANNRFTSRRRRADKSAPNGNRHH